LSEPDEALRNRLELMSTGGTVAVWLIIRSILSS
jgi:hypothetical protein